MHRYTMAAWVVWAGVLAVFGGPLGVWQHTAVAVAAGGVLGAWSLSQVQRLFGEG